ncbi:glycoside hydrolase family 88 protein [Moniliophthora roreri MCA 2997]|uniref:Glycoside hydrolase family 88 protein n=2 Tax=Moniliophthora roreri TaxID=221103 RepID=V2YRG5_MONRO|nr:glycoside hydrolase family 88 protein [Moniliophthora roreri MCA 2997]KAI3607990.1 glycoside hydrolase family 88 protein [Moniliophthora roreri]
MITDIKNLLHSLLLLIGYVGTVQANLLSSNELFSPLIPQKVTRTYNALPNPIQYPQWTNRGEPGRWQYFVPDTWTSGFFPLTLYEMHTRQTLCPGDQGGQGIDWIEWGRRASTGLANLPGHNTQGHDVGFLSFPFIEELAINPQNETAKKIVNAFARDLAARFNSKVGATRSWDTSDPTRFQVIIDNMMNLELLFVSEELTGNKTLGDIARIHADTTMKNHIREDGSTWHVVEYTTTTGNVVGKYTAQGYSDDSTWARGQAWGIYGFANMYNRTKNPDYLETARRLASYFLNNLPKDGIVPWDFKAPLNDPKNFGVRPADSSAATVAATGLLLLADTETDRSAAESWIAGAVKLLDNISKLAWKPSWESLLSNGTVNWPAGNYLTGIVYGDFYYIKAGNDLIKLGLAEC